MRGGGAVAFYRLLSLSGLLNPPTPLKLVPRIEGGGAGAAYAGRVGGGGGASAMYF
jgi:hypothetical protein